MTADTFTNYAYKQFNLCTTSDRLRYICDDVLDVLRDGVWLAGGALRTILRHNSEDCVADYDLFFKSPQDIQDTLTFLKNRGWEVVWECPRKELYVLREESVSDGEKIQLITRDVYDSMLDLISTFDFTACMAAYDGTTVCLNTAFIRHTKFKRLALGNLIYPVATINRIYKYRLKGFVMYQQDIVDLIERIQHSSFDSTRLVLYID